MNAKQDSDNFEMVALAEDRRSLLNELESTQQENFILNQQVVALETELLALEEQSCEESEHGIRDHELYYTLFESSNMPMAVVDSHGSVLVINRAAKKFLHISEDDASFTLNFRSYLSNESKKIFTRILVNLRQEFYDQELALENLSGEPFNPKFQPLKLTLELGNKDSILINLNPIIYSDMSSQLMRLHILAFDQIKEGVIFTNQKQKIVYVNQAFSEITGYTKYEALGRSPNMLSSGRQSQHYYNDMWEHIRKHGWWEGEIWNKNKVGVVYPEWLQISRIWDAYSKQVFYIAIFSDITGRKEEQHKLDRLAFFDSLTGLPNRESLKNFVDNLIFRTKNSERLFSMLFLDLDKFKQVNDRFGHQEGDKVLKLATQRIIANIRDSDYAARVGGDEFVIVLSRLKSKQDSQEVILNLIDVLAKPYSVGDNTHFLSATVGVSFYPDDADDQEELLRKADLAMYRAKTAGRNQHRFYEPSLDEASTELSDIQQFVHASIVNFERNIEIHYQPLYTFSDDYQEFECLVRLRRNGELIFPDKFIEASEHSGIIHDFGLAIFEKVCSDIVKYQLQDKKFAVNLSAKQFDKVSLIDNLLSIVDRYQLKLNNFNFEVTETAVTLNYTNMENALDKMREAGCQVLLDDFGTGYASLSMLKNLPVDVVKIDQSFVRDLDVRSTQEMVSAMVYMAKALNLKVVCEGVETQAQLEWLQKLDVDFIQGYLISRPKPIEHFLGNP